jgi:hypothetical protein
MEVAFEPYKKLTFQSYLKYETAEVFANVIALSHPPGVPGITRMFWANGILFRFFNHPPSEEKAKEFHNGHVAWDHIEFAPMAEYQSVLQVKERPLVTINVLEVSNHTLFGPVTKWIRDNL